MQRDGVKVRSPFHTRAAALSRDLRDARHGQFMELRSGAQTMPNEEASIAAEARSLIDWNTRNKVLPSPILPLPPSPSRTDHAL